MATFTETAERVTLKAEETTEIPPQPEGQVTASDVAAQKTPFDVIMERFDRIDTRLDQQGKAIVNVAEKVFGGPPQEAGQPSNPILPGGVPSWVGDLISLAKNQLGGEDPMKEYFAGIGKTVFDKTMESTMKRVAGSIASESARHVG